MQSVSSLTVQYEHYDMGQNHVLWNKIKQIFHYVHNFTEHSTVLIATASYCEAGACWFVVLSLSTGPSSNICSMTMGLLRPSATCARKKIIIGSDNGLSPSRRQALICTNAWNIVNSTPTSKLQWNINCNSCIFIPNSNEIVTCYKYYWNVHSQRVVKCHMYYALCCYIH